MQGKPALRTCSLNARVTASGRNGDPSSFGTMFADNTSPTPNDSNLSFWCGDPANTRVEVIEAPDPSLPDGGLPVIGHPCTWPEMKAQGWRAVRQEKPSHSFWCGDHECTAAELKKAKLYEAFVASTSDTMKCLVNLVAISTRSPHP